LLCCPQRQSTRTKIHSSAVVSSVGGLMANASDTGAYVTVSKDKNNERHSTKP